MRFKTFFEAKEKPLEDRTLKNKPKGKSIGEWMKCKNGGKSPCDGKYYGWSHRAAFGFGVGDKVKEESLGNYKGKEFVIKTEKEAQKCAERFCSDVS